MSPPRILLVLDATGRLNQLFKRVSSVNKSAGPFDAIFCVGQFFPDTPDRLDEFSDFIEGRSTVPIPTYFIGDYGVSGPKFLSAAAKAPENQGFKMDGLKVFDNLYWLRGGGNITIHELPGGTILSHAVEENEKFPVQFGREVLADLLNMADRADWKNCKLSKEEEIQMVEIFKNRFEEYDRNR